MGNGTKVALVALLILMVVVIARFVRDDVDDGTTQVKGGLPAAPTGKTPATDGAKGRAAPTATDKGAEKKPYVAKAPATSGTPGTSLTANNPAPGAATRPEEKSSLSPVDPRTVDPRTVEPKPAPPQTNGSQHPASTTLVASAAPGQGGSPAESSSVVGTFTGPSAPTHRTTATPPSAVSDPRDTAQAQGTSRVGGTFAPQPPPAGLQPIRSQLETPGQASTEIAKSANLQNPLRAPQPRLGPQSGDLVPPQATSRTTDAVVLPVQTVQLPTQETPAPRVPGASVFPVKYVVAKGDSPWAIAQKHYKNGNLWPQIEKANPGAKMQPGVELTIPAPVLPATQAPSSASTGGGATRPTPPAPDATKPSVTLDPPAPRRTDGARTAGPSGAGTVPSGAGAATELGPNGTTYVVQKGDTLSLIAKKFYRDANKYHLIEDANETLRYQSLRAGEKIKIPPLKK